MKIRGEGRKSRLFFKYLISYILILCIPLVFTSIFIFGFFNRILEDEITNSNLTMLMHINNVVDNQILEFKKISNQIVNNYKLKPHTMDKNTTAKMEAIQELKNYSIGNDFIYNLVLYVRNTDFIISASGTYDAGNFINYAYNYENWEYDDFLKDVNGSGKPAFRYSDNVFVSGSNCVERLITYIVPNDQCTVIFMIDENKLKNLISVKSGTAYENTVILDSGGNLVISLKDWPHLVAGIIPILTRNADNEAEKKTGIMQIREEDYFYSRLKSEITGWNYITLTPEREALKSVFNVRKAAFHWYLLIALAGCCIIYYATYRNYKPILNLSRLAEEKSGKRTAGQTEIEAVASAINQMADDSLALKKSLNSSRAAFRDSLLLDLLRGRIDSADKFNSMGGDIGLSFTYPFFNVCIFHSRHFREMEGAWKSAVIKKVEGALPAFIQGYGRDGVAEDTVVFILAAQENDIGLIKNTFQSIKCGLPSSNSDLKISAGIGNICRSTGQIGRSYLEAATAVDYKFIFGENKIILFNEIVIKGAGSIVYPEKELKDIQLYIKQGNIEGIENTLTAIVQKIKDGDMPIVIARCICFDMINSVLKVVNEIGISAVPAEREYFDIEELNHFNTPEELNDRIMRICTELCRDIRESKESRNFSLKEKLIRYVNENFEDQNFCVKSMADAFGMSQSYLSRFFKDQTGQTLSEYQMFLRMEKAKYYLRSTGEPLKNIVGRVGYCNEASFVRLFKKVEGITPGEFRKLSQNGNYI